MTFKYPELKTPPPPEIAIIDLDSVLFKSAQAGQTTWRIAKDKTTGEELARFESVKEYDNWIFEQEFLFDNGCENIERVTETEILDVELCYKAFDKIVKDWVKRSGCKEWKGWVGSKAGAKTFRFGVATYYPYKHGRDKLEKPYHLEAVRKYARKNPNVVTGYAPHEVDDLVVSNSEVKFKHKACLIGLDKDNLQCKNTYVLLIDQLDKPIFSSKKIIGKLWKEGKKVYGIGTIFTLWQLLKGDKAVDGIVGVPGVGDIKAYNLLEKYSGVCISHLPEAVRDVCVVYKDYFGEAHEYNHCYTGEPIVATWRDLFEENLRLLWMLRHKNDKGEFIMQHVPENL